MATWSDLNAQNANSPVMEQLIMFHDHTMMIITIITVTVMYMMMTLMSSKYGNRMLLEGQSIELIWTILPAVMLIFIALPSLKILYMIEETNKPIITIKAIGHQWFWSYEYSDFKKIEFDSYMKPTSDLQDNEFRLLETDNRVVLPFNTQTRILMTSTDVIHSWTVPVLGLKVDASPGRINQGNILMNRPGLFYGQCSEICGANHSFMPIVLESVNMNGFLNWLKNY
uniref:cytochrome c oxidase subunit II n=1 Tax=Seriana bacilla TaxID=2822402 RepID=UPI00291E1CBF|nr:cytochrome c oxidase subunit II [Seriana bacilla]WMP41089.1 cytochrome c oxidase subunit II [Seriana bacilla]WMP41090.1 cytochrome c oxidase subunit II [Seriana bacilla]WMP41092.1 cytochrome c oxidase subunit II [Seriana bacilla]WMP41093.1 cytochrome c oxidase subunit II [Seriana bacilla]WOR80599.1 cytochrome c oxidase subunit 2 [Seriana bacilla]